MINFSKFQRRDFQLFTIFAKSFIIGLFLICFFSFFCLGFLSQTFAIHRTAVEGGSYFFKSFLPLPLPSQTLRHQPGDYCRELTSTHSQQPDSNREPLVSESKSLTTKLRALKQVPEHTFDFLARMNSSCKVPKFSDPVVPWNYNTNVFRSSYYSSMVVLDFRNLFLIKP